MVAVVTDQAHVPVVVSGSIVFDESPSRESPVASPRLGPVVIQNAKGQDAPWIVRSTYQRYNKKRLRIGTISFNTMSSLGHSVKRYSRLKVA